MQTVWSRIAQTRGACSCPQCFQAAPGVSRRATASATRRAPQFVTTSTLWYSGIFAAAATFDAGAKKHRREQWDQAIAEVKQELGEPAEGTVRHVVSERGDALVPTSTSNAGLELLMQTADAFHEIEPLRRRPQWPTNTGPPLMRHNCSPESIYATDHRKRKAGWKLWTAKKLETVMLSLDQLQLEIFKILQEGENGISMEEATKAVPAAYLEKLWLPREGLDAALESKALDIGLMWQVDEYLTDWTRAAADVPLSNYAQDTQGTHLATARELTGSLQDLFRLHTDEGLSTPSLLLKVAYNLSISSAPANIQTYNTLLLGFARAQQPDLVYKVIRSLRETHMRPNEITNAVVLNHYTAVGDMTSFAHWVELMRGKHNALALARPDIRITEAGASRLVPIELLGDTDRKVAQLPYPTPNVFGAIVKGMLKFSGFDTALSICEGMGQEGWGLCMSGLTPLLFDCADRNDWTAGLAVWRRMQSLRERSRERHGERVHVVEQLGLGTYAAMLRLCLASEQKTVFQDTWQQALGVHGQRKSVTLKEMIREQKAQARQRIAMDDSAAEGSASGQHDGATVADAEDAILHHGSDTSDTSRAHTDLLEAILPPQPGEHRPQAVRPGAIIRELQMGTIKDGGPRRAVEPQLETHVQPPIRHVASDITYRYPWERTRAPVELAITREQLEGLIAPCSELDEYELSERPMTMHG